MIKKSSFMVSNFHRRRKALNIGGGEGGKVQNLGGGGGGGVTSQTFCWL